MAEDRPGKGQGYHHRIPFVSGLVKSNQPPTGPGQKSPGHELSGVALNEKFAQANGGVGISGRADCAGPEAQGIASQVISPKTAYGQAGQQHPLEGGLQR